MAALVLFLSVASGQDKEKDGIVLKRGMFSRELGMLDAERDEYASQLAAQAASQFVKGDDAAKAKVGRFLAIAKRLSPRNKGAKAVDESVRREEKPKPVADAYTPASLSQLLLTRGKLLLKEEGSENHWVGRAFVEMAADMDPKNKQAVKEREAQEYDFGKMDWSVVLGGE